MTKKLMPAATTSLLSQGACSSNTFPAGAVTYSSFINLVTALTGTLSAKNPVLKTTNRWQELG